MPPTPEKAREMLRNPPHGKKLTGKQERYFQGLAHGWRPSMKALRERSGSKR